MRPFLNPFLLLTAFTSLTGAFATEKPNIVLIMADDLGYADISPYSNEEVDTPHLERLAEQGTRLTQFYANAPVCSPTRAALLTGRYQQRVGVHAVYEGELSRQEVTIAQRLGEAGYATGIFGKWHVSGHARSPQEMALYPDKVPTTWGFDRFVGIMTGMVDGISHYTERGFHDWWHDGVNTVEEGYTTHLLAKYSTEFIADHAGEPFFLYVPLTDIHFPWMTPEDPPYYAEGIDNPSSAFPDRKRGGQHHGTDQLRAVVHRMIHEVDRAVGKIVGEVEKHGITEDTLIIFTSDNGGYHSYMNRNADEISDMGGLRGHKHQVYEGGIRVPMIASMPGTIPTGEVSDAVAMTFDFYPTFLDLAGLPLDSSNQPSLDGFSLLPLLTQEGFVPDRTLFWNDLKRWAMREGKWKLVLPSSVAQPELYDLASDRAETTDISSQHPGRVDAMLTRMQAWSEDVGTLMPFPAHTLSDKPVFQTGAPLFTDRTYAAGEVPETLRGMPLHPASIEGDTVEVKQGGEIVAITPIDPDIIWSQAAKLKSQGFAPDESIADFRLWPRQNEPVRVMRKQVQPGEVIHYRKVCLLLMGDGVEVASYDPGTAWNENTGETLHNGITLPSLWPPSHLEPTGEPMPVPYLGAPPEVIPIDVGRQLFVDDFLIEETDLERVYHSARKHEANPVFVPETAQEREGGNVVYLGQGGIFWDPDESHYKLFYTAGWRGPLAVATSTDMMNWERPDLDGEGNNYLLPQGSEWKGETVTVAGSDNAIWFDPHTANPMDRLRYLTCWMHRPNFKNSGSPTHSLSRSDGESWQDYVPIEPLPPVSDYSSFFYNPFREKWIQSIKVGTGLGRSRNYLESDTFLGGAATRDSVFWTAADRLDQPEPADTYPGDPARPQLYSLAAVAYESLMIGMHQIHRGPNNEVCKEGGYPKLCDLEVGFSRDGFHWHRPDRSGFIRGSREEGTWDRAYLHTTTGVFVVRDDQLVFPYCAYSGKGIEGDPDGMYKGASIGLATLRRDGFASMETGEEGGSLLTRPLRFSGNHLFVNLEARSGELTVDVLDAEGEPVAVSKPVSGDSTKQRIEWENRKDLSEFAGQPVQLRFRQTSGALYSFWVSDHEEGYSNGYLGTVGKDHIE